MKENWTVSQVDWSTVLLFLSSTSYVIRFSIHDLCGDNKWNVLRRVIFIRNFSKINPLTAYNAEVLYLRSRKEPMCYNVKGITELISPLLQHMLNILTQFAFGVYLIKMIYGLMNSLYNIENNMKVRDSSSLESIALIMQEIQIRHDFVIYFGRTDSQGSQICYSFQIYRRSLCSCIHLPSALYVRFPAHRSSFYCSNIVFGEGY
jgi:hypothetical protein